MTPLDRPDDAEPTLADMDSGSIVVSGDTVVLSGEIDTLLLRAWTRRNPVVPTVRVIDGSEVTFLGSAGLVFIVDLSRAAAPAVLKLRSPTRALLRPLSITNVDTLLEIVD